ncbi:MAG: hypothetical protein MRY83_10215 [Flavobacteriales bacterium]|nr:hypothetical protein [Flavobacteriales bacterium]
MLIATQTFADSTLRWSVDNYEIVKDTTDASVKPGHGVFEFFITNTGIAENMIQYAIDDGSTLEVMPKNGIFSVEAKDGLHKLQVFLSQEYFEIFIDSIFLQSGHRMNINLNFQSVEVPVVVFKPVLYLYSDKEHQANIELNLNGSLDFTYPKYDGGWSCNLVKDGLEVNGKKHSYLFWDGELNFNLNKLSDGEGFIIEGKSVVGFLEEKLTQMNFNAQEKEDFITFWAPKMSQQGSVFIHFIFNEDYNEYANLTVTPKTDNQFRVFMFWADASGFNTSAMKEQTIPKFRREKFHLLEWGGTELNFHQILTNFSENFQPAVR